MLIQGDKCKVIFFSVSPLLLHAYSIAGQIQTFIVTLISSSLMNSWFLCIQLYNSNLITYNHSSVLFIVQTKTGSNFSHQFLSNNCQFCYNIHIFTFSSSLNQLLMFLVFTLKNVNDGNLTFHQLFTLFSACNFGHKNKYLCYKYVQIEIFFLRALVK